jgi:hypothetical protein
MFDLKFLAEGFAALKSGMDGIRGALSLWKEIKGDGRSPPIEVTHALEKSERQLQMAETQIAMGLGYTLCECTFPPTPMLTVGWIERGGNRAVHSCPRCGITDNGGVGWTRSEEIKQRNIAAGISPPSDVANR